MKGSVRRRKERGEVNSLPLFEDYRNKLDKEDWVALNINADCTIINLRRVKRNCEVIIHKHKERLPDHDFYLFAYIIMLCDQLLELLGAEN